MYTTTVALVAARSNPFCASIPANYHDSWGNCGRALPQWCAISATRCHSGFLSLPGGVPAGCLGDLQRGRHAGRLAWAPGAAGLARAASLAPSGAVAPPAASPAALAWPTWGKRLAPDSPTSHRRPHMPACGTTFPFTAITPRHTSTIVFYGLVLYQSGSPPEWRDRPRPAGGHGPGVSGASRKPARTPGWQACWKPGRFVRITGGVVSGSRCGIATARPRATRASERA